MHDHPVDIVDALTRLVSNLTAITEATDPEGAAPIEPRFMRARLDRWRESLADLCYTLEGDQEPRTRCPLWGAGVTRVDIEEAR